MVELTYVKNKRRGTASTNDVSPASPRAPDAKIAKFTLSTPESLA